MRPAEREDRRRSLVPLSPRRGERTGEGGARSAGWLAVRWVALLLFACPPIPTVAQNITRAPPGVLLPGIGENDPRRRVDITAAPWRALGRVQLDVGGRCTGTLIAPVRPALIGRC